jgi:hypothetical protein
MLSFFYLRTYVIVFILTPVISLTALGTFVIVQLYSVVGLISIDVPEKHVASIFRIEEQAN